jgi:RimJ/RimL family protein N-acetyltransferase
VFALRGGDVKSGPSLADNGLVEPRTSVVLPLDVIETSRLLLQRWDDAHFDDFLEFMRDPDVIRYIRPMPLSDEKGAEHHARSLEEWDVHGFGKRAVLEARTGNWLGFVELSLVGPGKGCREDDVEIGYFIVPARWGQGLATEAAIAVRDEAFGRVGLYELIGRSRVENTASARVMAKAGFRHVRSYTLEEGVTVDIHRISRDEWIRSRLGTLLHSTKPVPPHEDGDRRAGYRETG